MSKEHATQFLAGERAICQVGHTTYVKGHVLQQTVVPSTRLLHLRTGKLAYHYDDATVTYHAGQMWLVPELTRRYWVVLEGKAELAWVEFVNLMPIQQGHTPLSITADALNVMMLDRIIACWEQQSDSSHMEMAGLFDALLLRFALHVHDSEPIHKPHVHTAIPKVLTYLATHADDCRVLDHLHQRVNLSINHFRKVFKQATGMNPTQYMLMLRLRKAKYLLLTTSMNVQQIAYALGYENAQHFSRQYKQCWGMSPKQDRMSAH